MCSFVELQIILIVYIYQIMNNTFGYIDIILLAMIAAFIILRLRNILGKKTGHEEKKFTGFNEKQFEQFIKPKNPVNIKKEDDKINNLFSNKKFFTK